MNNGSKPVVCERCGQPIPRRKCEPVRRWQQRKWCNLSSCETPQGYLAKRTRRAPNGCLEWIKGTDSNGYGQACLRGRHILAHRLAYEVWVGPIPDGLHVLHRCDNPPCGEPTHLFLGTQSDNSKDRHAKGRTRTGVSRGSLNGCAKLSDEQVAEIRRDVRTQRQIAAEYKVSQRTITKIKRGISYKIIDRAERDYETWLNR